MFFRRVLPRPPSAVRGTMPTAAAPEFACGPAAAKKTGGDGKMRPAIPLLLLLMLLSVPAMGAPAPGDRIAVVNMETVFRQYYKSRIAADTLRRQSEIYRAYVMAEQDKLKDLQKEIDTARDAAQNLALSTADREAQKTLCADKEREFAAKRAELNRYMLERNRNLSAIEKSKRDEILQDIRAEAAKQAVAAGYSFVLDSSGMTTSGVPAVIYARPAVDLTAKILKALNAAAAPAAPETEKK